MHNYNLFIDVRLSAVELYSLSFEFRSKGHGFRLYKGRISFKLSFIINDTRLSGDLGYM